MMQLFDTIVAVLAVALLAAALTAVVFWVRLTANGVNPFL